MNYEKVNQALDQAMGKGKAWVKPATKELEAEGFDYSLQLHDDATQGEIAQAAEIVNAIEPTEWAYDKMTIIPD